jgi:N-methylhydantoinase B
VIDNQTLVDAEIHRKKLDNIINEMSITLVRTSGSPIVTDAMDFSTCLLDSTGEQLGLATNLLAHSASSWLGTKAVMAEIAKAGEHPRPGDSWLVNDPYEGGALHQGDMGVITPMFYLDEIVAWAFANMHLVDVGGSGVSGIAPGARTVYEEGLRFPPIRAIRAGKIDNTWERYIGANVRAPVPVLNDIRSMIAASNVAQAKLTALLDKTGQERFNELSAISKDLTEQLLRKRIEALPDGRYEGVDYIEYDGQGADELLEVRAVMEVDGSDLRFSFEGAPQITAYVNGTNASIHGNVMVIILTTLGYGDLPFNSGMWGPLTVDVGKPGTVVNATAPAPVSTSHADGGARAGKVVKALLNQALSLSEDPALRARVAGVASDGCATAGLFGIDDKGRAAVLYYMDPGAGIGGPAQSIADGQDSYGMAMMAGCGIPDVELHEATDPVLFLWRKIAPNSGGAGQFRGGQGMDQAYVIRDADQMGGFFSTICAEVPPSGTGGGLSASGSTQFPIRRANVFELMANGRHVSPDNLEGVREAAKNKDGAVVFRRHDVLQFINGGGSGLGDSLLRPPAAVAKDVRDGYITAEHAAAVYGVVCDPAGNLDGAATVERQAAIRHARLGAAPAREMRPPASVGVPVEFRSGDGIGSWACGYCGATLCPAGSDWHETGVVVTDSEINATYRDWRMNVVPRTSAPDVVVTSYYCPECAGCLQSVVAPEGMKPKAPKLKGVR